MKMFVWRSGSFLAVAHAESIRQARQLVFDQLDNTRSGQCQERELASRIIHGTQPVIWHGKNAEFVLTDSGELREADAECERLRKELAAR